MLYYLKMLEILKNSNGGTPYLEKLSKAQPFVIIAPANHNKKRIEEMDGARRNDLPFKMCSFEMAKGFITKKFTNAEETTYRNVALIVAEERDDHKIVYYLLHFDQYGNDPDIDTYTPENGEKGTETVSGLVNELISYLKNYDHGHISPRTIFKWKDRGTKKQIRINKVIYVGDKSSCEISQNLTPIQWSHAFWVMGHWREIKGIGKNREGEYGIFGRTWITEYTKNSEIGDPIKKIRVSKIPD